MDKFYPVGYQNQSGHGFVLLNGYQDGKGDGYQHRLSGHGFGDEYRDTYRTSYGYGNILVYGFTLSPNRRRTY